MLIHQLGKMNEEVIDKISKVQRQFLSKTNKIERSMQLWINYKKDKEKER